MKRDPIRWKNSSDADPVARELLSAGRPTSSMPAASRLRGERRVGKLAAAPAVALGIGLWSKAVAAAFGAGFVSALTLVSISPALQERLGRRHAGKTHEGTPPSVPMISTSASLVPSADVTPRNDAPPADVPPSARATTFPTRGVDGARRGIATHSPAGVAPIASPETGEARATAALALSGLGVDVPTTSPAPPERPPVDDRMSAEVELLSRARLLVSTDPDGALHILNQHARLFPDGALTMEREVLVIEALQRSGRHRDAAERAQQLLAAAPGALYAARLRRVIGDDSGTALGAAPSPAER